MSEEIDVNDDDLKDIDYSSEEEENKPVKKVVKKEDSDIDSDDLSIKDEDVSSDLPSDEERKKKGDEEIDPKLFSGEQLADRKIKLNEEELTRGNKLIDALVKGHSINIEKFKAKEEEESSEEEDGLDKPKFMVNVMGLGSEEYCDEYKRLFGDIEDLPKGLRMWRIEKFLPVKIPIHHLGRFYTKETYLILNINEEDRGGKEINLHMWMGNDTTMDKSGGAAFRFSELGGYLKAMSRMNEIPARLYCFREEQGEEREEFKSYFEKYGGFSICEGGTSSGFKAIEKPVYDPTLYLVRNERHSIQCPLSVEVLNVRLVYLLDAGEVIYVWFGAKSSYFDRFKATEMATQIVNKERKGRAMVVQIEDGETEPKEKELSINSAYSSNPTLLPPNPSAEFWRILGLSKAPKITKDEPPSEDYPAYRFLQTQTKGQNFDLIEITERPLKQEMLSPKHCVIIDCFYTIYNWKGKNATEREKAASTILSKKFFEETANRPKWAKVVNIHQTAEPIFFREKFLKWVDYTKEETKKKNKVAVSVAVNKIDVQSMLREKYFSPDLLDEGKGDIQVWCMTSTKPKFDRLHNFEEGVFYRNYSYIVLYSYLKKTEEVNHHRDTKRAFMVYFWQGRRSSIRDYSAFFFGFLPAFSKKLKSQGSDVEYKVLEEGSEVEHFLTLFKRVIVVNDGIRYSITDKATTLSKEEIEEKIKEDSKKIKMYDCRMQLPSETVRCMEVPVSTSLLHSYSTILLITPTTLFIWFGSFTKVTLSSSPLQILLTRFLEDRKKVILLEGSEEDEQENATLFWRLLGGRGNYCKFEKRNSFVARLFLFYHDNGKLQVEELANYSQSNLKEERVYLLDCEDKIYLWYGSRSSQTLRMHALFIANSFVRLAAASRTSFIPLEAFESGSESDLFKWRFHTWFVPPKSSFSIVEEKRESRRKRLEVLEYYRKRDEEEAKQFENTSLRIQQENNKIRTNNQNVNFNNTKLRKNNQFILSGKKEDAIILKQRLEREEQRRLREEQHRLEMERMDREREERIKERERKRNNLN